MIDGGQRFKSEETKLAELNNWRKKKKKSREIDFIEKIQLKRKLVEIE